MDYKPYHLNTGSRILLRSTAVLAVLTAVPLCGSEILVDPQAVAFLGINTTGVIRPAANYTTAGMAWQTTTNNPLTFDSAAFLQAQGLENPFMQALSNELGAGWSYTFNTTATIADNTFRVHTYEALAPGPPASNRDAFAINGQCGANNCVGAQFFFNYVPTGDDPSTNVHWVQILYDNYLLNGNRVAPFFEIDNNGGTVPYYDVPFAANGTGFLDTPFVTGPGQGTVFNALTLLVTGPPANAPGQFTIYGGIEWGWSNQAVPEPSTAAVVFLGLVLCCTRQLCGRVAPALRRISKDR